MWKTEPSGYQMNIQFRCPLGSPKCPPESVCHLWVPNVPVLDIHVCMAGVVVVNSYQWLKKWNHISEMWRGYEDLRRRYPVNIHTQVAKSSVSLSASDETAQASTLHSVACPRQRALTTAVNPHRPVVVSRRLLHQSVVFLEGKRCSPALRFSPGASPF